ncbi:MAG: cyclic pyranopterin monophosphate synthase MoaC [Pirellulaceae bacterium]|nr:cyclic pyranopterin monophosphate synthase MoaC [Pirellulaceae bacterium]
MTSPTFSHLDAQGNAQMVDVGEKPVTRRSAVAEARVRLGLTVASRLQSGTMPKGDVLQVARIAAIGAAKRTDELIPLCHSLPLDHVKVQFSWPAETCLLIQVEAVATARTGVEMEALVGASLAALTVYDMCKALDKGIVIEHVQLVSKTGGASGDFKRAVETQDGPGS